LPIPEETIHQIKERADITRVIGEYVPLKRAGKNYKGLCPFHTEKTPSFIVSPDKGIYHCFGCGAGGNVFSFVMQFKGLTFPEAVRYLGDRVGIRVGSAGPQTHREERASVLREIMSVSAQYFQKNLSAPFGAEALKYLQGRSLTNDTMKNFNLGYARDSWDALLEYLRARGYEAGLIEEAGLAVKRKSGSGYYDRFRNRIMFPILDRIGRCVGFGGRILGSNNAGIPKYINTSENLIFHKGSTLYGLSQAEESLKKLDHAFVVEGYIDVIRMHDQGLRNTVAPLGTALTEEHIALILRYTRNMYLIFDPDEAGVKAALRSTTIMHRRGVDPFVIRLPGGYDPGNFFDTYSVEEFLLMKDEAVTGIDFIIRRFAEKKKVYTAHEKISILESLSEYYENMRDDIFKEDFIVRLSKALGTDSTVLKREIIRGKGHTREAANARLHNRISPEHETGSPAGAPKSIQTELYLLLLILSNPQYLELAAPRIDEDYFHGKWTKNLWRSITRAAERGDWDSSTVFNSIGDDQFVKYLSGRLLEEILVNNPKEQLIDTIATLKEIRLKEKLACVSKELRKAELDRDETRETDLLVEKNALTNELKKIEQLRASKIRL
jgi:DNA primase